MKGRVKHVCSGRRNHSSRGLVFKAFRRRLYWVSFGRLCKPPMSVRIFVAMWWQRGWTQSRSVKSFCAVMIFLVFFSLVFAWEVNVSRSVHLTWHFRRYLSNLSRIDEWYSVSVTADKQKYFVCKTGATKPIQQLRSYMRPLAIENYVDQHWRPFVRRDSTDNPFIWSESRWRTE